MAQKDKLDELPTTPTKSVFLLRSHGGVVVKTEIVVKKL